MKNTNRHIINYFIFVLFILIFPFFRVDAADLGFFSSSNSYNVGDTINVKVYVNSESKSINAVSANIKYSSNILSLSSISKTGSIINLWAQDPSFSDGVASLEGVILGGYNGSSGNVVTLIFRAKKAGIASFSFSNGSILANDGNGTEVLSGKGVKTLNILDGQTSVTPIVSTDKKDTFDKTKEVSSKKDTTISISEIKNNNSQYSLNKFLIISPQPVADKSYNIQIDSLPSVIWSDDGTHIFQASDIIDGDHVIKVIATDINSNTLSGFLNFSTVVLKVPEINYYSKEIYVDQLLVLKGIADPSVNIELIISNIKTGEIITERVMTNSEGEFIYVPKNKILAGTYSIVARAIAANGLSSGYMSPIKIVNKENNFNFIISKFSSYLILLIPLIALVFLAIIMTLYLSHHTKRIKKSLNKKIMSVENIVSKSFDLLSEDENEEIAIFRKIVSSKLLDKNEAIFLDKFKKDIREAEKIIQKELKEVEKTK